MNTSICSLKFALLNVRSLINKTFIINDFITSHRLNCILLTETWLDATGSKELTEASPPNFSFLHCYRENTRGGGVAAIFSDHLSGKNVFFGSYSTFEYISFVLRSAYPCLALTVYRPPRLRNGFIEEFAELLSNISVEYASVLISGDLNIHMDDITDHFAHQFTDMLSAFDFTQHVVGPTHSHGHTLDLVISKGLDVTLKPILDVGISDHFCIFFDMSLITKREPRVRIIKRHTFRTDTPSKFILKYSNRSQSAFTSNRDPNPPSLSLCDNLVNDFNQSVTQILDDIAPLKIKTTLGKLKAPWRNIDSVRTLKRACRKSERKWRKTKLRDDYNNYREMLSIYKTEIRRSRQHYFSLIITENRNNSKFLFSTIDKLVNAPRSIPPEFYSPDKCNEFAAYFNHKVANIRNNIVALCAGAIHDYTTSQCHTAVSLSNFSPIQVHQLQKVIQQTSSATFAFNALPTKVF